MKYKNGELYAKKILENVKGLQFDSSYHDDNSEAHMPDFRLINGDYIEVTHTNHNMNPNRNIEFHGDESLRLPKEKQEKMSEAEIENFYKNAIQKACQSEIETTNAEKRHSTGDYETDPLTGEYTESGKEQQKEDCKLLEKTYGINKEKGCFGSEFKADRPITTYSIDNIIHKITVDKSKKYEVGNNSVYLFIFITSEEMDLLEKGEKESLTPYYSLLNIINKSQFKNVFICEWDFDNNKYNLDNPKLLVF